MGPGYAGPDSGRRTNEKLTHGPSTFRVADHSSKESVFQSVHVLRPFAAQHPRYLAFDFSGVFILFCSMPSAK